MTPAKCMVSTDTTVEELERQYAECGYDDNDWTEVKVKRKGGKKGSVKVPQGGVHPPEAPKPFKKTHKEWEEYLREQDQAIHS